MKDKVFNLETGATRVRFLSKVEALDGAELPGTLSVFDLNTSKLFSNHSNQTVILDSGEASKSWRSVERILEAALDAEIGRDGCFFGIGGGVIGDMTAFGASIYMRGCGVILVPTTLLAMIDASVGGKTGIDFRGFKNMLGTFYPASEVRICIDVLGSLPQRDYKSGLSEVIKHAFLGDGDLLKMLENNVASISDRDQALMLELVSRSIDVKGHIVEQDAREQGIRAHLNFGHTFAHALESAAGFTEWTHGEAVAWGIDKALKLGVILDITDQGYAERVRSVLRLYDYRLEAPTIDPEKIIEAMRQDKKKRRGLIQFVLQKNFGQTILETVEPEIVRRVL